jgi:CelD/BcsL family acetyltransferase involved in cellulose biosynthesis
LPVATVQFMANYYSSSAGMLIGRQDPEIFPAISGWLERSAYRPDLLWLDFVPKDSRTDTQIRNTLATGKYRYREMEGTIDPYIKVAADWETFVKSLSRKVRNKISNMNNVFAKHGVPQISDVRSLADVPSAMEDLLEVSRHTWKYAAKTAIANSTEKIEFYTQFATLAASLNWLNIRILTFQSIPIAFQYTIAYKDTVYFDKIGFDERYRHLSPGLFLMIDSIKEAFRHPYAEIELLGDNESFKSKLTSLSKPHCKYWVFSGGLYGKLLCAIDAISRAVMKIRRTNAAREDKAE